MIKFILALLLIPQLAFAGLPPTASKVIGDTSNVTTFNYQFPNFAASRSGTTTTLGLMNVSGLSTGTNGQVLAVTGGVPVWSNGAGVVLAPTVQKFTSGSGTYTPPSSPAPVNIRVRLVGGGGGGSGAGVTGTGAGNGTGGGNTTFGTLTGGGGGGGSNGTTGGTGGSYTLGAGFIGSGFPGGNGLGSMQIGNTSSPGSFGVAGGGGVSPFGGAGTWTNGSTGGTAGTNTGSGGGGGSCGSGVGSTQNCGTGGGAGGYIDALTTPASFSYSIGTGGGGGGAGTSGQAGGAGAAGYIEVTEYYGYTYVNTGGTTTQPGVTISSSTTANQSQVNFFCNAASGSVTVSLPQISTLGSSNGAHQLYCLKKIDSSANSCIFSAFSGDLIDGTTTNTITAQYTTRCIIDNAGTAWYVH